MNDTDFPWTERILKIPYALAAKWTSPDTQLYEELVSLGNEELVSAAARWREDGGASASTFLYRSVEFCLLRFMGRDRQTNENRWRNLQPLVSPEDEGDDIDASAIPIDGSPSPDVALETANLAAAALAKLPPLRRAILQAHLNGMPSGEMASRLEVTSQSIVYQLNAAIDYLRRSTIAHPKRLHTGNIESIERWREHAPATYNRRSRKAAARAGKRSREAAIARRALLGHVYVHAWYLVDREAKVALGPAGASAAEALATQGIHVEIHGSSSRIAAACLGWPELTAGQANVLSLMANGQPRTSREVASVLAQYRPVVVNTRIVELCRAGLLAAIGKGAPTSKGGQPPTVYHIADAALASRGPVCCYEPMAGRALRKIVDNTWDVREREKETNP